VTHQQVARPCGFQRTFLNPSQIALYGRHQRTLDPVMLPAMKTIATLPVMRRWLSCWTPFECLRSA
jgi:hypothetical protein